MQITNSKVTGSNKKCFLKKMKEKQMKFMPIHSQVIYIYNAHS